MCGQNLGTCENWALMDMDRWKGRGEVVDCELRNRESRSWTVKNEWIRQEEGRKDAKQRWHLFWIPKIVPVSISTSVWSPDRFPDELAGISFGYLHLKVSCVELHFWLWGGLRKGESGPTPRPSCAQRSCGEVWQPAQSEVPALERWPLYKENEALTWHC